MSLPTRPAPVATPPEEELSRMSLLDHLAELRRRLLWSAAALGVAFALCWTVVGEIFELLARPVYPLLPEGTRLAFLGITDPLILYLKVAALAAVFVASPFLFYQAWRFIAPGLYRREKYWAVPFVALGSLFFMAGGAFGYLVAFPFAAEFLLGLGAGFEPVITVERYFRFLLTIILGLGLMFQLPLVVFILAQIGVASPRFLLRQSRWAILIIFIVAAIITPTPDAVNLFLFATPTVALYFLGVGAAYLVERLRGRG